VKLLHHPSTIREIFCSSPDLIQTTMFFAPTRFEKYTQTPIIITGIKPQKSPFSTPEGLIKHHGNLPNNLSIFKRKGSPKLWKQPEPYQFQGPRPNLVAVAF